MSPVAQRAARTQIVVGVDGSDESQRALDWAANEAALRGCRLRVVQVIQPWPITPSVLAPIPLIETDELAEAVRHFIGSMVKRARATAPSVKVDGLVLTGSPSGELLHAATGAVMLVVGSKGHGAVGGVLLGSVSTSVAVHATVPVVVTRLGPTRPTGRIIVGVDGSPASAAAVDFSIREASQRGASVTAIHVSTGPFPLLATTSEPEVIHRGDVDPEEAAAVAETLAGYEEECPDVSVERIFMVGHPVPALIKASHGADLLVVGSRGHGAFTGRLLGSVSLGVLHLASGPVAVVRNGGKA
jgi:nucleotide-binding universal stress UspA family protein